MRKIDWTKCSAIADILGAVAIVATLLYLAVQTQYLAEQTELLAIQSQQNTAAVQAATRQAMLAEDRELLALRLEFGVQELMIREVGSLSDDEKIRLSTWLVMFLRNRENQWLQRQSGVIDEATWLTYSYTIGPILSYEVTRPWWVQRVSRGEFDPGFVGYVNGILAERQVERLSVFEVTGLE